MGFHIQSYVAMAGRAINPVRWKHQWHKLEGKQFSDVAEQMMQWTNKQFAQIGRV